MRGKRVAPPFRGKKATVLAFQLVISYCPDVHFPYKAAYLGITVQRAVERLKKSTDVCWAQMAHVSAMVDRLKRDMGGLMTGLQVVFGLVLVPDDLLLLPWKAHDSRGQVLNKQKNDLSHSLSQTIGTASI